MASITITTTTQQDARLVAAFTAELRLAQDATATDIKGAIIKYLQEVVTKQEKIAAYKQAAAAAPITPT